MHRSYIQAVYKSCLNAARSPEPYHYAGDSKFMFDTQCFRPSTGPFAAPTEASEDYICLQRGPVPQEILERATYFLFERCFVAIRWGVGLRFGSRCVDSAGGIFVFRFGIVTILQNVCQVTLSLDLLA